MNFNRYQSYRNTLPVVPEPCVTSGTTFRYHSELLIVCWFQGVPTPSAEARNRPVFTEASHA